MSRGNYLLQRLCPCLTDINKIFGPVSPGPMQHTVRKQDFRGGNLSVNLPEFKATLCSELFISLYWIQAGLYYQWDFRLLEAEIKTKKAPTVYSILALGLNPPNKFTETRIKV